jgi:hypothetical protein
MPVIDKMDESFNPPLVKTASKTISDSLSTFQEKTYIIYKTNYDTSDEDLAKQPLSTYMLFENKHYVESTTIKVVLDTTTGIAGYIMTMPDSGSGAASSMTITFMSGNDERTADLNTDGTYYLIQYFGPYYKIYSTVSTSAVFTVAFQKVKKIVFNRAFTAYKSLIAAGHGPTTIKPSSFIQYNDLQVFDTTELNINSIPSFAD